VKYFLSILLACLAIQPAAAQPDHQTTRISEAEKNRYLQRQAATGTSNASDNFTLHYANCRWEVDPATRFITGRVALYILTTAAANTFTFDLSNSLVVDSVLFRGNRTTYTHNSNGSVSVTSGINLPAAQRDSVVFYYHGVPGNTGFGSFIQDMHSGTPVIWTLSEPYGAKEWWPCRNGLDDKVDSIDIAIVHPAQYTASSNGVQLGRTTNGSVAVTRFKHRYPVATYLVAFAVTNYVTFAEQVNTGTVNLPVITRVYPESLADFQAQSYIVLDALQLYSQQFGEYPFKNEQYGQTQFGWGGGMEHQTNSFVVSPDRLLMVHELAHQWFGDKITTGSWQDLWLNEGFATYCSLLYHEWRIPPATMRDLYRQYRDNVTSQPGGSVRVSDTLDVNRLFNGRLTYDKGAYLLHMLRWTIGDSAFFRGMKAYATDPQLQYGFTRTPVFKRHMETAGNRNLDYFFDQWYAGEGFPGFNVEWTQNANNWARIRVRQTASLPSVTSFFQVPLEITFRNAQQARKVRLDCTTNDQEFWAEVGFVADTVLVDEDYHLLSANNSSRKITGHAAPANTVTVYPNPVQDVLHIAVQNPTPGPAVYVLYNSAGQLVQQGNRQFTGQDEILPLSFLSLPKGTYFIHLQAGGKKYVIPVVK
jgi:aminopeptidase N